jgi:AbrB family looped-hinge helix DNA binding protein
MARVITIDDAGRTVIPKDLRRQLGLRGGSRLRVRADGDRLVLEPEQESEGVREEGGLLIATGRLVGASLDHRDLRQERLDKLGRMPR